MMTSFLARIASRLALNAVLIEPLLMSNIAPNTEHARASDVEVREVSTIDEYDACVRLQRDVFGLPDLEISPRRHLIVSCQAGGWTLGAFVEGKLVGFVHHLAAVRGEKISGYSHMMAVAAEYQNHGIGGRLKWAQRARALSEGRDLIRWTFEPTRARNAHFNLNRLGVVVRDYAVNFYGADYVTNPAEKAAGVSGMDSDRLFASWELYSPRVEALAAGAKYPLPEPERKIEIPTDYSALLKSDPAAGKREQLRVREEFLRALGDGLVCRAFERDAEKPRYLFYEE
ncbi:MAG TPA: GNAT family N-acetyltransferase [Pyrinomonadaceae bacterium]|nr:GNAT family N-acetyltransferase [Pyrinomonadaceae bacterium]